MKLNIQDIKKALSKKEVKSQKEEFSNYDYTIPTVPLIIEKKRDPWVNYGADNLYPLMINDLRAGSGMHNSILKTKTKMTGGDGLLINGAKNEVESESVYRSLDAKTKAEFDLFKKKVYPIVQKCADDLQEQGQFCFEGMWNSDFTKFIPTKYYDVKDIRAGKLEHGEVTNYYYCRDWSKSSNRYYTPREIKAFNPKDKENINQIVFRKFGNNDFYGDIPYKGGLYWIQIDFKMGLYHLSNIDNGMNPGLHFRFYKKPKTIEEKQGIIDELNEAYRGSLKVGTPLYTFSNGKDEAIDIQPIQIPDLDKQLLNLAELCDKKILTAHQLTSPMLAGLTTSGQLGGVNELEIGYKIFDRMAIESDRNFLIEPFNEILALNKVPLELTINPFNPLKQNG